MAQVNQPVLHGKNRFEPDIDYDFDPETEAYFSANGWIVGSEIDKVTAPEAPDDTYDIEPENRGGVTYELQIDDSVIGVEDSVEADNG